MDNKCLQSYQHPLLLVSLELVYQGLYLLLFLELCNGRNNHINLHSPFFSRLCSLYIHKFSFQLLIENSQLIVYEQNRNIVLKLQSEIWNFPMRFSIFFFRIRHPFLSKCLLRMRKCRKSNLIHFFFFFMMKVSEAVCKHDWHNMMSYLFFNVRKVRTKISDSVYNDLCWNIQICVRAATDTAVIIYR